MANDRTTALRMGLDGHPSLVKPRLARSRRRAQPGDTIRRELERSLLYSEELGIELAKRNDAAYFRWFLASLLFGARISETTAKNTYRSFVRHSLTSPQKILKTGWDFLVYPVMREGGYVRYDGRKSTQVLRDCELLVAEYGGCLSRLHDAAHDARDLEQRLLAFYGVGPVTMNIFLRELRPFWAKTNPDPLPAVERLAKRFSIDLTHYRRKSVVFARVEAGLIRRRRELAAP
jgi:endonuclease III